MTKDTNGNGSELIVLGRDDNGKPLAARFPSDQASLVAKAAKAMSLTVGKANDPALAELAKKLPIGRLYSCRQCAGAYTTNSSSNCNSPVSSYRGSPINRPHSQCQRRFKSDPL